MGVTKKIKLAEENGDASTDAEEPFQKMVDLPMSEFGFRTNRIYQDS